MSNITIPPEALEAAAKVLHDHAEIFVDVPWEDLSDGDQEAYIEEARAAFVAMVEAWPEAKRVKGYFTHDTDYYEPAFILPLMENPDDQA